MNGAMLRAIVRRWVKQGRPVGPFHCWWFDGQCICRGFIDAGLLELAEGDFPVILPLLPPPSE